MGDRTWTQVTLRKEDLDYLLYLKRITEDQFMDEIGAEEKENVEDTVTYTDSQCNYQ